MSAVNRRDLGLFILRVGTGAVLAAHGTQKLFGWFGGGGLTGTSKAMEAMGFRPGRQSALAAGLGEAGGGTLLMLGLATPAAGAVSAGAMAGAVSVHAPAGFFNQSGGFEYPAFLGFTAAAIGVAGAGRYSLDHATRHHFDQPWTLAAAFVASALAAAAVVGKRAIDQAEAGGDTDDNGAGNGDTG
ncbi:DoxX family protein [Streptomyces sp. WAC05374]|uniref:DoxX family protein n=1 Tax=Streptomyces sp. WAC05374 TaxID=2487420 RepID=UPI000F895C00|nr:DoxX family protein [Streptomyces sp. WAC05374]RST11554.1 DoxX family protein [Streptomyces sp. WAC05374]TDF37942.1 DoxX family protein [Streptomyces sp. WAC05374]TDF52798.1 DoxX family protein [Streptomyces sp. WAC05374]TDF54217.1 DoxX family protein [Streptomyces sp. WAC05374]